EVAKYVGAYAAALNGLDVLTFTAGVGENDAGTRAAICEYLGFLGIPAAMMRSFLPISKGSALQAWTAIENDCAGG
ncbi:MAG: hypothetical protein IIW84_06895, partial [Selenomonadaceae bacterium]|nr:hypothetical protein [Selenomonadaceae bacterium]